MDLDSLERQIVLIQDRVVAVARRYNAGFFLYGPGGSGKSYSVSQELNRLRVDWTLSNSDMSAAGLFDLLYDCPHHVHVLEDLEQLYSDRKAVGFLRAATWGDSNGTKRVVTKTINKKRIEFEFTGGIIILSNTQLGELPQLKALATRLNPAEFNPTEDQKKALMRKISAGSKFGLSGEACKEVCEFLIERFESLGDRPLDLRLLDSALKDRRMYDCGDCRSHWKDIVDSRITSLIVEPQHKLRTRKERKIDERDIARQIYDLYPDSRKDRDREWATRTGKSGRALYRRAAEIGLEAPRPSNVNRPDISQAIIDTERFVQGA